MIIRGTFMDIRVQKKRKSLLRNAEAGTIYFLVALWQSESLIYIIRCRLLVDELLTVLDNKTLGVACYLLTQDIVCSGVSIGRNL